MPITFSQPQPLDLYAAAALAQSQTRRQDEELAIRRQQLATQAGIAQLEASTRAGLGDQQAFARMSDREQEAQQFAAAQRQQWGLAEMAAARDMALQRQRTQDAAWLSQQEMSQAETFRLQRLENELARVNNDDNLSQEDKAELLHRIRYKMSPLQERQERTRLRLMDAQAQEEEARARQIAGAAVRADQITAMGFQDRVQYLVPREVQAAVAADLARTNPTFAQAPPQAQAQMVEAEAVARGLALPFLLNRNGDFDPVDLGRGAKAGKEEGAKDAYGRTPGDWQSAYDRTVKEIDDFDRGRRDQGLPPLTPEERRANIATWMRQRGFAPSIDEHFGKGGGPREGGGEKIAGDSPKGPTAPTLAPFDPDTKDTAKLTPQQMEMAKANTGLAAAVQRAGHLSPERKDQLLGSVKELRRMMGVHGGRPPEGHPDRKDWDFFVKGIDLALRGPITRPVPKSQRGD